MAPTVALLSPGSMGAVVGGVLRQHGAEVITCLEGRSAATAARAREAGIEAVADDAALVERADLLLSILVPSEAVSTARRVAAALEATSPKISAFAALEGRRAAKGAGPSWSPGWRG